MPRRHRRAPEEPGTLPRRPQAEAPMWALVPGFDVRRVSSDKPYVCPGCERVVHPRTWHLVVVPQDEAEARRHWHEGCWRVEINRMLGRRRGL